MGNFLDIGSRLAEERKRLNKNQTDFAAVADVTRKTLFGYESGERAPDAASLAAWSAIGVDVLYVVTGQRSGAANAEPRSALSRREAALLDNYRHCSDEDQRAVERASAAFAQSLDHRAKIKHRKIP